jgi:hypothetical protein
VDAVMQKILSFYDEIRNVEQVLDETLATP